MTDSPATDVTQMLQASAEGDEDALDRLFPLIHREVAGVAHAALRREGVGRLFQTTELVNEAHLRLVKQRRTRWQSRSHFSAVAAQVMRRILSSSRAWALMSSRSVGPEGCNPPCRKIESSTYTTTGFERSQRPYRPSGPNASMYSTNSGGGASIQASRDSGAGASGPSASARASTRAR